ncbi:Na/Pi cotransporter family protein [Chlorobium phaeovibrioides]|uniref:Na/Pi cotransporter family protein n=1 Tax=Chlorobium phaeovibrioides TaxID=1094 RepID=A0A5M8IDU1_CHLPH|nr:Na/Pi cotransporter family protein [Chlorobium phaeovibrioides]KAA6232414.1 Na/Pi cotransporter family protein [Chlorobium phaeovibrioides]
MEQHISLSAIALLFAGGLALFLYGMRLMASGMKKASGDRVRRLISAVTANRLSGLFAGAFATMVVQSSSTIIATLVGLVQSRLMLFSQSLAVILGAEIGTTAMAQLIAFRLHDFALVIFTIGFVIHASAKNETIRFTGEALSGFGLLFFGLKLMSEAVAPLEEYQPFLALLRVLDNPVIGVLTGTLLTGLIQSSGAFIAIVMTLGGEGSLSLEAAIPLLLGANIGTCITGILAGSGMGRPARRVAYAQVAFNLAGVVLFIWFIPSFADAIRVFSLSSVEGASLNSGSVVPRQIANAHSIYNVFMAFFLLPFLPLMERLLYRIYPDDPEETRQIPAVWYLQESALDSPALALGYARAEISRTAKIASRMVCAALHPFIANEPGRDRVYKSLTVVGGMAMREEKLDFLEKQLSDYLIKISRSELNEEQSKEVFALMDAIKSLESMGDVIDVLRGRLVRVKESLKAELSEEGKRELLSLHSLVCGEVEKLPVLLEEMDGDKAAAMLLDDRLFCELVQTVQSAHFKRVQLHPEAELTHDLHMELINVLQQVHHYTKGICRTIAEMNHGK